MQDGLIFLSHSSLDKDFVNKVYEKLDSSNTFYDVKSISPGQKFIDKIKNSIGGKNVFVLFYSSNTKDSWSEYEQGIAEINHVTNSGRVLVVLMGGESVDSLPSWMKIFHACCEDYSVSDIVRQILYLQKGILEEIEGGSRCFVGREALLRQMHIGVLRNIQETGVPIQHFVISGLPGMGRRSLADAFSALSLRGMSSAGPTFNLPDMAEAVDFYLAIKQDIDGKMAIEELESHIKYFQNIDFSEQAEVIFCLVKHWVKINKCITFITRWGLRDRSKNLKPWLLHFIEISASTPSLRIIYISERRLPDEKAVSIPNLSQIYVEELEDIDIHFMLNQLIYDRYFDSAKVEALSHHIHGHPLTAHFVGKFVNSGKNLDTLNENPDPIYAFQQRVLGGILSEGMISERQKKILAFLSIFPKISFSMLLNILDADKKELSRDLWDLQEVSLISATDSEYYSCPGVVSTRARKELEEITKDIIVKVRSFIHAESESGRVDSQLIDALLIACTSPFGEIPKELIGLVTSSSLLSMVSERYNQARNSERGAKEIFLSAYHLSKLAMGMATSDDAVEQILYTGGDSAIRAGVYPSEIIDKMRDAAISSVYYLQGSYEFHVNKNDTEAVKFLKLSLGMKHFKLRNTRLLVRALIRLQDFHGALAVLDALPDWQLERETGLIIQKIRAYRGIRQHEEARKLERKIQGREDEYGEVNIYHAGRALREEKPEEAISFLDKAEMCPRVNKFTLQLLKCAVLIEKGDPSLLPLMVETANSINRKYDALQLQARYAVVQERWEDAERYLSQIEKKDYFDLQIYQRMLRIKMEDDRTKRDVVLMKKCMDDLDEIARQSLNSPEGYRDA